MDKEKDIFNPIKGIGNNLFVGCMFIGFGIGFYFENMPMGMFIGMGVGFISKAILTLLNKN